MKVVVRVDASIQIGSGHVARCLTLAKVLRAAGAEVRFLCRDHPGHLARQIRDQGFALTLLSRAADTPWNPVTGPAPQLAHSGWLGCTQAADAEQCRAALADFGPVDWLIVDHYALDARWQEALRTVARQILVIDDLADRDHACDLLLDQNLGRAARDYADWVLPGGRCLCGPTFALLRPEFAARRAESLARQRSPLRQLLITLGGVDQDNVTGQVLAVLQSCDLPADMRATVVMGAAAPHVDEVRRQAGALPFDCEVVVAISDMGERMMQADLAIGAAGSTTWERACLGLPSLIVVLAENQRGIARAVSEAGAALFAGDATAPGFTVQLQEVILRCLEDPEIITRMSAAAADLVDGAGATRVQQVIQGDQVP